MEWFEAVNREISVVSDEDIAIAEPDQQVGPREHVVGVASVYLRGLFTLIKLRRKRAMELLASTVFCREDDRERILDEGRIAHVQTDALQKFFWASCRYSHPELWTKSGIGVRKGWQIVWIEEEEKNMPDTILAALFKLALD
jgi:hypothetical protein